MQRMQWRPGTFERDPVLVACMNARSMCVEDDCVYVIRNILEECVDLTEGYPDLPDLRLPQMQWETGTFDGKKVLVACYNETTMCVEDGCVEILVEVAAKDVVLKLSPEGIHPIPSATWPRLKRTILVDIAVSRPGGKGPCGVGIFIQDPKAKKPQELTICFADTTPPAAAVRGVTLAAEALRSRSERKIFMHTKNAYAVGTLTYHHDASKHQEFYEEAVKALAKLRD